MQEFNGDYDAVKVPRSTEVATWKFILEMCDKAAASLPDATTQERANKWTAYALKSRAALYAASVGKFWDRDGAMLTGEAVTEKLVGGFTDADVKFFYEECIKASAEVIRSGKFSLYGENPASLDEAAQNFRIAVNMEPQNLEYRNALSSVGSGAYTYRQTQYSDGSDELCGLCSSLMCLNCLCGGCR